jgi:hypothetical protein
MRSLIRQNRDLRIDLFRGIALWSMFIDHLIRGSLRSITFRQYGFCDSAELFVLLSGISAGMVYGGTAMRKGVAVARLRVLSRVAVLYRTHLVMMLLFVAEAGLLMAWLKPPMFLEFYGLDAFAAHPYRSLLNGALLRFQPENMDILPLYIVLLLTLCAVLPCVLRWPRSLLSVSVALYVATRVFNLEVPGWPGFFNPLAWQALFVIGIVANAMLRGGPYWRGWDVAAALFALFSLVESHANHLGHFLPPAALIHVGVDKSNLHPYKLLAILALAWLAWRYIPVTAAWLRSRWAAPLVLLGQHSLPVFVASVFLSMAGEAWFSTRTDRLSETVIQGAGSLALLALAAWCGWKGRDTPARVPAVAEREAVAVNVGA